MGKKLQGAKLRAIKRAKLALEDLQEQQAENSAALTVTTKSDADLFVIDRVGAHVPHHLRPPSQTSAKAVEKKRFDKTGLSAKDQQQVDALLQVHDAAKITQLAARGRAIMDHYSQNKRLTRSSVAMQKTRTNFDLWNGEEEIPSVSTSTSTAKPNKLTARGLAAITVTKLPQTVQTLSGIGSTLAGVAPSHVVVKAVKVSAAVVASTAGAKRQRNGQLQVASAQATAAGTNKNNNFTDVLTHVAVDVAKAGQSYHPDPVLHQALLQTAAELEVARNSALHYRDTPISQGLSAETKALLLGDDDDSSDEEDVNPNAVIKNAGAIPKRANKLTKAQRNKQKRLRVERAVQRQAKMTKKLMNEVSEVPRYKNEMKKQLRTAAQIKQDKLALELEKLKNPVGKDLELKAAQADPLHAPTFPVALPTELRSSLRSIKPKGSLVLDRIRSLTARRQIASHAQTPDAVVKRKQSKKKRKLSVKGKHNRDGIGDTFEILG